MKRSVPFILVAAVALIAAGLFLRQRDPAVAYTENRDAWSAYQEGESLLQAFRYAKADSMLRAAVALDPDLAMAHTALAELSFRRGVREDGILHYALADSLVDLIEDVCARRLLQVRLSMSEISRFHGQRDSLLAEAQKTDPDHIIVLLSEAMGAAENDDLQRAEELYQHVLKINPNYAGAYNFLGYLYLGQGKYDEAEAAMRRYAFVAPDLANPHDSLGDVLMTVGRYEEAEAEFRTALAKDRLFFYSQKNIGWIYLMRGQVDKALELLDQVIAQMSGTAFAENLLIELVDRLYAHRLNDDLTTYAQRYLETYPEGKGVASVKVRLLLGTGQTTAALAMMDSVKAEYEQAKWYGVNTRATARVQTNELRYRAVAAEDVGAHEDAARLFQDVLTRLQDAPPHYKLFDRIHLAYNLIPLQAYDDARVQVADALRVNPRISEGVLVAASIEAAAGEVAEARRLLDVAEQILERADPDYPVLGDIRRMREQLPDPDRI